MIHLIYPDRRALCGAAIPDGADCCPVDHWDGTVPDVCSECIHAFGRLHERALSFLGIFQRPEEASHG